MGEELLYSANTAQNALLTGMKPSPKILISSPNRQKLMDFSPCWWKFSHTQWSFGSPLTDSCSCSAELSWFKHSICSSGGLQTIQEGFFSPRIDQAQAKKQESLDRDQERRAIQSCPNRGCALMVSLFARLRWVWSRQAAEGAESEISARKDKAGVMRNHKSALSPGGKALHRKRHHKQGEGRHKC